MKFLFLIFASFAFAKGEDPFPFLMGEELVGTFVQKCAGNRQKTHTFSLGEVVSTEINFQDEFCLQPNLKIEMRGTVALGNMKQNSIREIDFEFISLWLTPLSSKTASAYSQLQLCGISEWAPNTAREITGLFCDFYQTGVPVLVPAKGNKRYGIYKLQGDFLWMGALSPEKNSLEPSRRPLTLEQTPFLRSRE